MSLETVEDATRSAVSSRMPHLNVTCQTCRVSRTYLTLQGVNMFFLEHEGHKVVEGKTFERPDFEASEAPADPSPEAQAEVVTAVASSGKAATQELVEAGAEVESAPPAQGEGQQQLPELAQPEEQALETATPPLSEEDLKEPLLLARSSYIGESTDKRSDALRVSRALKEFKWNVEPPYVIGVMVDDSLSVETNVGVISSSMVERVEKLGYKLVAINAPQGSPVAWFKKESKGAIEVILPVGDPGRVMQINQGKRTYDKDKAVWEESFVSLLMSVKDMDVQKLKRVTSILKSDEPEPDLKS